MLKPRSLVLVVAGVLLCFSNVEAQEDSYSYIAGHTGFANNGEQSRGYIDAMIMYKNDRPVVCFGMQRRPGDKGRYLYLMLFNPDVPKGGFSVTASGKTDGDKVDVAAKFTVQKCEIDVAYAFEGDDSTSKLKSEKLKISGEDVATNPPQVYLADVSGDKLKLTPVKVKVRTSPPDLADEQKTAFSYYLDETIKALKKDSPEVAKFLEVKR